VRQADAAMDQTTVTQLTASHHAGAPAKGPPAIARRYHNSRQSLFLRRQDSHLDGLRQTRRSGTKS
jgi:hypothetical protein